MREEDLTLAEQAEAWHRERGLDVRERGTDADEAWFAPFAHLNAKESRWQVIGRTALLVLLIPVAIFVLYLLIDASTKCPPEAAGGPCI